MCIQFCKNTQLAFDTESAHGEPKPGCKTGHARAFPMPHTLQRTNETKMNRLTGIDVFKRQTESGLPQPLCNPRKHVTMCMPTDFGCFSECSMRKLFPLLCTSQLLQKLRNFECTTAIDQSMRHCSFHSMCEAKNCTVIPQGKCRCKALPMGIASSKKIPPKKTTDKSTTPWD